MKQLFGLLFLVLIAWSWNSRQNTSSHSPIALEAVAMHIGGSLEDSSLDSYDLEGMNVHDYYLMLPKGYFGCDNPEYKDSQKAREDAILKKNIKNGYIESQTTHVPMEVVLFKDRKNNRDLIAIASNCGAGCLCQTFTFMEYKNGQWLTAMDVLPMEAMKNANAEINESGEADIFPEAILPEFGTTIEFEDPVNGGIVYKLHWNGINFQLSI